MNRDAPIARRRGVVGAIADRERSEGAALRAKQVWFAGAIMSPAAEQADADVTTILTEGPRLSASERLDVYRRAYVARLVECLADDYPSVKAALGEQCFESLCRAYVARHPSTSPNLNAYGRTMADFCREQSGSADLWSAGATPAFAADLATLEWAMVEVIHAPSSATLTPSGLAQVPVERWADARLGMVPALRLLRFGHPVNAYLQALRQGEAPAVPGAAPSAVAVYRSGATIWRMDLSEPMFDLLRSLASGETLGTSLERAAARFEDVDEAGAVGRVMDWFREWVSSGLFSRITFA